jgi:hypothetical protein
LTENAGEVRRKREMESKFQQDNQNRVKPWNLVLTSKTSSHTVHLSYH